MEKQGFAFENPVLLEEKQDEPFYGEKGSFLLSPFSCDLIFKGKPIQLAFSEEDYRRAGVPTDNKSPAPAVLLRLLAESMGEELYEQEEALLRIVGREKAGLRVFLRLKHWHHPDLADEELPSQSSSLSSLAKALEDNNPEAYHCPPEEVNSFWYHWGEEHNGWE